MFPLDFAFFPKTWVIPAQLSKLKSDMAKDKIKRAKQKPGSK